ncbi:MAG: MucR family transcriptional regulator [Pseudomonadota bacterium]
MSEDVKPEADNSLALVDLTADVVSAYVSHNVLPANDVAGLIKDVHSALGALVGASVDLPKEDVKPAVPPKKSITPDYLICLEDGKRFKSLKRHLKTHYDLSPDQYRDKWGLPSDYPMVAPNYAKARSQLAKDMGLGQRRAKA